MSCPYTSPQNFKVECIIHSVNNVVRTLLIQASLPGRHWAEGLHTATYLLNRLPTTAIQAVCPHLALFGSAPSYEHLRVFGCTCYTNRSATAPHKLSPRSTRCVILGYSVEHKVYRCLDLSTNHLIISRHVVSDDNFLLAALTSPTSLDFLCESGRTVSIIGTHLTTTDTSTLTPCRPAPKIPPSFEPPMAPLPAPAVPPGFLPRAASTAMPHAAPTTPSAITDGLPPRTWPASPVAYVRRPRQPASVSTTPPPPHSRPSVGGQGMVVPVTPPENPHQIITRGKTGFRVVSGRLVLTAMTSSLTPSPIPSSARDVLVDPHWCAAVEEEYGALISNGN
jgi:hypothetical protein